MTWSENLYLLERPADSRYFFRSSLQSGTKVVDTLLFHSFIISFPLNAVNPPHPTPEPVLAEVNERLEGPKYNIDFWREGVGVHRGRE